MLGALLAWEHGAGRNHILTLNTVADALRDRFSFDAAFCDLTHADEMGDLCSPVQGPWLPLSDAYREARGNPRRATWAEFLGDVGFRQPNILRESIGWWQGVMRECRISLVIADAAPCALLAARGLGIPSVAIGTGYLTPPPDMPDFPILLPRYQTRIHDEAEIVAAVNSAITDFGCPPIERLPEIYRADDQLVFSLDMLDPYFNARSQPLLPPITGSEVQPAGTGEEVFVYFSTTETSDPRLVEAVGSLGVPVRAFMPGADGTVLRTLSDHGVIVERTPVPVEYIAARSRLIISAAQHGTLCTGLGSGLAQVAVPQHIEQEFNAEAAASRGVLKTTDLENRSPERFKSIVLDAYEDAAMARRARDLAETLQPQFTANRRRLIRRRVAAVMDYRV